MWGDPAIAQAIGAKPFSSEETWARMLRYAGLWQWLGFGYWAVEEKSSGLFVGDVGFADFRREMTPSIEGRPELGWVLIAHAHGRGYATEAVRAALHWGNQRFAAGSMVAIIGPDNRASIRVAEKCGFVPDGNGSYRGNDIRIFTYAGTTTA